MDNTSQIESWEMAMYAEQDAMKERLNTANDIINIGDTVKVKGTSHTSTVKNISNKWFILKDKNPSHCCNFYDKEELELIKNNK